MRVGQIPLLHGKTLPESSILSSSSAPKDDLSSAKPSERPGAFRTFFSYLFYPLVFITKKIASLFAYLLIFLPFSRKKQIDWQSLKKEIDFGIRSIIADGCSKRVSSNCFY